MKTATSEENRCQHCGAPATTNGIMGQPRCCDACDNLPMSCDCAKRAKTDTVQEMTSSPRFSRVWAMPSSETFTVPPIGEFVQRYLAQSAISIDPFARNNDWATYTNDINPNTTAMHHVDAEKFLESMVKLGLAGKVDLAIVDPPYSPRQVSECYREAGIAVGMADTQNAALYARVRAALLPLLTPEAIVLSFGWNSAGMGKGWKQLEIMLVAHGGAHNDTICLAEQRA